MKHSIVAATITFALFIATTALAWTGPTATAPNGNIAAPLNVGTATQTKIGSLILGSNDATTGLLGVNGLAVFGNSLFGGSTGSNAYLNFGNTSGSSGYGIRDNSGTLEFKNSGA